MFRSVIILALAALLAAPVAARLGSGARAPLHIREDAIEKEYIVMLEASKGTSVLDEHLTMLREAAAASGVEGALEVRFEYRALHRQGFLGYAAHIETEELLEVVRAAENVRYVESDQTVTASCEVQSEATWGLQRIAVRDPRYNGMYSYDADTAGADVDIYVIDTGVQLTHVEFEGRARWGFDSIDSNSPQTDLNGHGTHVAGTCAGATFGVAKKADIVAVRVLNANGGGTQSGVIAGIDYTAEAASSSTKKSVANMSLGGGYSSVQNEAVDAAVAAGTVFVVAAGNSAANTCRFSPASAESAISVGATDASDTMAYFSNYGSCTDVFAPGVDITSAWIGTDVSDLTISGTSMAAPHVAGVAAILLSGDSSLSPADVEKQILDSATTGALSGLTAASPNRLLFSECM